MASVAAHGIPDSLLQIMERAKDTSVSPEGLVRDAHRAWKDAGGTVGGKPRHSDRFLGEQLAAAGLIIRSLTPKLNSRTRIRSADAEALLRHMLSHWPQPRPDRPDEVDYVAIAGEEVDALVEGITERIDAFDAAPEAAGGDAPSGEVSLPGEDSTTLIVSNYKETDALFTVATDTATVMQEPSANLIGFVNLMNRLRAIEQESARPKPLIWIVNRGKLRFDDRDSRLQYLSMHGLITRLKAIKYFKDKDAQECWNWLERRACVIVYDVTSNFIPISDSVERPEFEAKDLLLINCIQWTKDKNFKLLYGSDLERIEQRSFSVFLKQDAWEKKDGSDDDLNLCRYFGYAPFSNRGQLFPRGLEIPSPGSNYELAFRTTHAAAIAFLQLKEKSAQPIGGNKAIGNLEYLGFRMLTIREFINLEP